MAQKTSPSRRPTTKPGVDNDPLSIVYRPIKNLKLDPRNPRLHSKQQIQQLTRSIEAFGFIVPVLVDTKGRVIAGHGRILAARPRRLNRVPTICIEHLTETQIRAFMIADNRLTENSTWDDRLLAEQLKALSEVELTFSLEATGFEMAEIDLMIEGLSPAPEGDEDPADALPDTAAGSPVTRPGDLWLLGPHRVACGDALEDDTYGALMDGRQADAVFTDAPFNDPIDRYVAGFGAIHHAEFAMASGEMTPTEFTEFLAKACSLLARHSVDGSLQYLCMDWRHAGELLAAAGRVYSEFKNLCVWVKDSGGQGSLYRSQHELVFVFKNGRGKHRNNIQLGQFGRYRTNVWNYPRVNAFARATEEGNLSALHPTVKPVALVADAIMDCTARSAIVLDGFLGSGTTVIAAERTGRVCYGIEIDPGYVDTAIRRCQAFTGKAAVHAKSGRTFNELEEEAKDDRKA